MSSTSSSDNICYPELRYDSGIKGACKVPVYPNLGGHPLIYYAHIPQDCRQQRNKFSKKNSPNCFVKAFRWYTQELPSPQAVTPCNNINIGGFAAWLDKKYEEFLNDSNCEQTLQTQFRSRQCSLDDKQRIIDKMEHIPRTAKKFARLKSPWKKKRRFIYETERGGMYEKKSFEYLLRPQDISRAASECCQRTSSYNRSDATFVTSKSPILTKIKVKSHSTMCLTKTKDVLERQINITNYDDETLNTYKQTSTEKPGTLLEHAKLTKQIFDYKSPKKTPGKGVICECKRNDLSYKSVMTQYSKVTPANRNVTVCCQCSLYKIEKADASSQHFEIEQFGKDSYAQKKGSCSCCKCCQIEESHQPRNNHLPNIKFSEVRNLKQELRLTKGSLTYGVQTSDHSIIFKEDPLVVKILCENE